MAGHLYAGNVGRFTPADPPAPTPLEAWKAGRVAEIDAQLAEIAAIPPLLRTYVHWHRLDRLLDLRNGFRKPWPLRPSVPGHPGAADVSRVASEHTLAIDGRRVLVCSIGASWAVSCYEPDCNVPIVGYRGRDAAVKGGMGHLLWHVHGMPTCRDCGAWLSHRTARRCRKSRCEVDR